MSSLVTFGETMLRLSPPVEQPLSRTSEFDVHVGGAESNVAAAASAFDIDATWLSALPETPLGDRIVHGLQGAGVSPELFRTDTGRVGTYYLERGPRPRGQSVTYDRKNTPIRSVTPDHLSQEPIEAADIFYTSGITPALSATLADTTDRLLDVAAEAGTRTALDVNYRAKLWSPEEAREQLTALFPSVDVLFVADRDARSVLGHEGDPAAIGQALAETHGFETVVVTRGADGALVVHDGTVADHSGFDTETVDPVGSGDALVGGFLARRLAGDSVADAVTHGTAAAALSRTVEGDMCGFTAEMVADLANTDDYPGIDR